MGKNMTVRQVSFDRNTKAGFTIVELLIVVVVIAILAAITIVAYNGVTARAIETVMKSDLQSAVKTLELDKVHSGAYPANSSSANEGRGLLASGDNVLNYARVSDSFCVSVTHPRINTVYSAQSGEQVKDGPCPDTAPAITAITGGIYHSCAVVGGRAYCWGWGMQGQLGTGNTADQTNPTGVDVTGVLGGKTVTAISGGGSKTCAVADGRAYCWGDGVGGDLGNGNGATNQQTRPIAVDATGVLAGKTVTAITSGTYHSCALADGRVYCWGYNTDGQIGNGGTAQQNRPVEAGTTGLLAGKTVTAITSGLNHNCALADGQVYCWGNGTYGELGNGALADKQTPVAVDMTGVLAGKTVTAITSGASHSCALADGQVYCWGNGAHGQLGNGALTDRSSPVAAGTTGAMAGKTVTTIGGSGGGGMTCAVASGQAYCWGENSKGSLGDKTTVNRSIPVAVDMTGALTGKTVTAIASASQHTCATAGGKVHCWGFNNKGQLGDGTAVNRSSPVVVNPFPEI